MTIAIVTLIVLAAILLVLIILAQDPKSGGFNSGFSPGQFMGVQKTTDLLEKLTWGFAGAIMIFAISTNFIVNKGEEGEGPSSANIERAKESASAPAQQPAGAQPAAQPADAGAQPAGTPTSTPAPAPATPAETK